MGFKDMAKDDLRNVYETLGDEAIFSRTGETIFVFPEDDFDIETLELKKFRTISSDVVGIKQGDTLTIDGIAREIRNFNLSDDGLEMYVSVKDD